MTANRNKLFLPLLAALCTLSFSVPACAIKETYLTDEQVQGSIDKVRLGETLNLYFAMLQFNCPEEATRLGIHNADFRLDARDMETDKTVRESLRQFLGQVLRLESDSMLFDDRLDLAIVKNQLQYHLFVLEEMTPLRKDPLSYLNAAGAVFDVISRDFASYSVRAQNALARLEKLPGVLLESERNLYHPPEMLSRQALVQADYVREALKQLSPLFKRYTLFDPLARAQVEQALDAAKKAVARYKTTMTAEVLPVSDGDSRVGTEAYAAFLRYRYGSNTKLDDLEESLEDIVKSYEKEYVAALATRFNDRKITVSDYDWPLRQMERDAPTYRSEDELVGEFQKEMERGYRFFDKKRLFVVPQERLRFMLTPAYLLPSTPYASYRRAFPLDSTPAADMLLAYPDKRLKKEQREQLFRSRYAKLNIEFLSAQEIMPGRHMRQSALGKASVPRKAFNSPWLDSGWALYALKISLENDYFSDPELAQLLFLRWKYLKAVRGLTELRLHARTIGYDSAIDFISQKTGMSKELASAEALYMLLNPGEGPGHVLGYEKLMKMRAAYQRELKDKFDLREFHMRLLWLGNLPFDYVEETLLKTYQKQHPSLRL